MYSPVRGLLAFDPSRVGVAAKTRSGPRATAFRCHLAVADRFVRETVALTCRQKRQDYAGRCEEVAGSLA